MWFKEKNGKELEISHVGNDETFQEEFVLSLSLDKGLNDERWKEVKGGFNKEYIELEKRNHVFFSKPRIRIF